MSICSPHFPASLPAAWNVLTTLLSASVPKAWFGRRLLRAAFLSLTTSRESGLEPEVSSLVLSTGLAERTLQQVAHRPDGRQGAFCPGGFGAETCLRNVVERTGLLGEYIYQMLELP